MSTVISQGMFDIVKNGLLAGVIGEMFGRTVNGLSPKEIVANTGGKGVRVNQTGLNEATNAKKFVRGGTSLMAQIAVTGTSIEQVTEVVKREVEAGLNKETALVLTSLVVALTDSIKGATTGDIANKVVEIGQLAQFTKEQIVGAVAVSIIATWRARTKTPYPKSMNLTEAIDSVIHISAQVNHHLPDDNPPATETVVHKLTELKDEGAHRSYSQLREQCGTGPALLESVPFSILTYLRNTDDAKRAISEAVNAGGDAVGNAFMVGVMSGANNPIDKGLQELSSALPIITAEIAGITERLLR